jgi:PAS domain S-box-containing protein
MIRLASQGAAAGSGFSRDQLLEALLESSDDAIIAMTLDGTIRSWNRGATVLYGYSAADAIGQPFSMLCPPDRKNEINDLLERIGRGERIAHHETTRLRKNGKIFPVSVSIWPIRDADGTIVGASSSARGLSAQQLQAVQSSQALLASIVEFSPDGIISVDLDGVITSWNAGAERIYGYTAAEAIGRGADLMVPDEQLTGVYKVQTAMAEGERVEEYQAERVRKDGTRISVRVMFTSLSDSTGAVTGMSAVVRDITAQQRAGARFRGLLEAAPDAMVCADAGGRIVLVNAAAERLFGYPREELDGQLVEILVPDAVKAAHPGLRAGYSADSRPRLMGAGLELSGRRRDGSIFPAEIALSVLETGQGVLTLAAVRDVTIQRRARHELQRANGNLKSLLYSIAHDLRTPLRSVAGFSAALEDEYADVLGETGLGYTGRIVAASLHMGDVLDSLAYLSRISGTEISLHRVDLGAETAAIAAELQRQDPDRHVTFTIQQPAWALADAVLIRTVLTSLLDNAWKFTAGRDAAVIEFAMTPARDGRVCCCVRDNGAGFDSAFADKLFIPFQRLHAAQEFPGIGIGLAAVRQIVDLHGGRTWAEGTVGHGASFSFDIPAAELTRLPADN